MNDTFSSLLRMLRRFGPTLVRRLVVAVTLATSAPSLPARSAPGDRPEGRVLVRAQALQQRMFSGMWPLVRTLERAYAGTPAWWIALRDADLVWLAYMRELAVLDLPPGQLRALTWSPSGALHRFDLARRAGFTLALTGAFVMRPRETTNAFPKTPDELPKPGGRVRFSGRSRDGATVVVIDTDRCQGDARTTAHYLSPKIGFGARRAVLQRTGLALPGGAPGQPGRDWEALRKRDRKHRYTRNPFIRQSTGLVRVAERKATWIGPGQRREVEIDRPPSHKQLRWRQRACCGWTVDTVLVDAGSGRAFAGLVERCKWNAIEGDACYDPAQREDTFANQHCRLREMHWVRFGKIMRTNELFERPVSTIPVHKRWRLPRAVIRPSVSTAPVIPRLAEEAR